MEWSDVYKQVLDHFVFVFQQEGMNPVLNPVLKNVSPTKELLKVVEVHVSNYALLKYL